MYIYFLPLPTSENTDPAIGPIPVGADAVIPTPTPDGGVEHTAARFYPPSTWTAMADAAEIILFPPQYILLTLLAKFLLPVRQDAYSNVELQQHRRGLEQFVRSGDPSWTDACISPVGLGVPGPDGRNMLKLDYPGDEVAHLGRRGISEYVVMLGRDERNNPKNVEVILKKDLEKKIPSNL